MAAQTNYFSTVDPTHPGVNQSMLQEGPIVLEIPQSMADDDTTDFVFPAAGDTKRPPIVVQPYRHTGGDMTSAASATFALSNGDTLEFQVDPDGNGVYATLIHTLAAVSPGAATAAEIAASFNADTKFNADFRAVAGLTANAVSIFPKSVRGACRVVGGTASALLAFPGTGADNKKRTYVSQSAPVLTAGTGWSWSYVVSTRTLTVKNETGGAVTRTAIFIQR